jgi:gamma-glutamyltranspeptidase/glutathione hydrolase/leukotriene-C4 hydrolase
VDAAIASMVCNGAVHSHSNGIGGGFFMTIYKKATKEVKFLNAREKAPSYATKDMFKNPKANSQRGILNIIGKIENQLY